MINNKKHKEQKIFVTGIYGSGKTFYAKQYSTLSGLEYVDFDSIFHYNENDHSFSDEHILNNLNNSFIIDAIPFNIKNSSTECFLNYVKNNPSLIICCMVPLDVWINRVKTEKGNPSPNIKEYYDFYYKILPRYFDLNILFYDSISNTFIDKSKVINQVYNQETFKTYLNKLGYDKNYQDIDYINLKGYSESYKTWENIKDIIPWKDKKVADLGSFHGYFSFKIQKMGGIVTAFDRSLEVLKTTAILNILYKSSVNIQLWNGGDIIPNTFDISLCLNMLHHCADQEKTLQNILSKLVIFEINRECESLVKKYFKIIKQVNSHRKNRIILLGEKI